MFQEWQRDKRQRAPFIRNLTRASESITDNSLGIYKTATLTQPSERSRQPIAQNEDLLFKMKPSNFKPVDVMS